MFLRLSMVRDGEDVLLHAILDLFDELHDVDGLIESTAQSYGRWYAVSWRQS